MENKQLKLAQLRRNAEALLKKTSTDSPLSPEQRDEIVHEMQVYQLELELQFEDMERSYLAMQEAQRHYAELFDFAPVGYLVVNNRGLILKGNEKARQMLGLENERIEKRNFAEFVTKTGQDDYYLYLRAAFSSSQAHSCELQLLRQDGSSFHALLNARLPDKSSDVLNISISNISTIKEAEASLSRALAEEKEINQLRLRMLSVISHEFRTPLTIILSSLELLYKYGDKLDEEKKDQRYQTIRNLVWYLTDTIQDASSIQNSEEEISLKLQDFDILAFTRQIVHDMESISTNGQKIVLETITGHESEMVRWDQKLFRRILMNLLSNALKYSNDTVYCRLEVGELWISLWIQDQGIGIPAEDQERIYEAFYRGKNAEFIPGSGLGLFAVARAVEAHQGTIRYESQAGEGTKFILELPRLLS